MTLAAHIRNAIECARAIAVAEARGERCTNDTYDSFVESLEVIDNANELQRIIE